jgi:hypothetical protein
LKKIKENSSEEISVTIEIIIKSGEKEAEKVSSEMNINQENTMNSLINIQESITEISFNLGNNFENFNNMIEIMKWLEI